MLASLFFVSGHKCSATRCGRVPRGACRGASACRWHASYEPTEAAAETSPSAPAKKERQASACLSFFVSAHKDSATRHGCAPAQCVSWGPAARWAASRPDRGDSRDKSFCPCHKPGGNTAFLPGFFLHVVHGNGVRFGSNFGFSHLVLSVPNRCHPLQHPKRTRFRLFLAESGAFSSFLLFFWCKIFVLVFVHPAA